MKFSFTIVVLLVFLQAAASAGDLPDPLFQDDATLAVTITGPLTTVAKERPKEDYVPGQFSFTAADGTSVSLDVEIRTRGHFRHETCDFPPLTLNFKKSQTDGTLFDKQDKMKLVVHCDDSKRYEQAVLREFLAYRILSQVTNLSFRVRLLRVTYVDSEHRRDEQVRYAFLLEHKNRLAKRIGRKDLEIARTKVSAIQPDQLNLTSVFAFLIGNTDFSPVAGPPDDECCHNYVLFGSDVDPILAIPYDFDQSGFVDAPYALPNENLRIRSVTQRLYRGRCANNEHLEESIGMFSNERDKLFALIADQEGLDSRARKQVTRYLDDYYENNDDPRDVQRKIINKCL